MDYIKETVSLRDFYDIFWKNIFKFVGEMSLVAFPVKNIDAIREKVPNFRKNGIFIGIFFKKSGFLYIFRKSSIFQEIALFPNRFSTNNFE